MVGSRFSVLPAPLFSVRPEGTRFFVFGVRYGSAIIAIHRASHADPGRAQRLWAAVDRYVSAGSAGAGARVQHRYGGGAAHAVDLLHRSGPWPGVLWADRRSDRPARPAAGRLRALHGRILRLRAGSLDREPDRAALRPGAWRLRRHGALALGRARYVRRAQLGAHVLLSDA